MRRRSQISPTRSLVAYCFKLKPVELPLGGILHADGEQLQSGVLGSARHRRWLPEWLEGVGVLVSGNHVGPKGS